MQDRDVGRVVVGVDDSLAGLRALREAVKLARRRGMEVRAVCSYRPPADPGDVWWYPGGAPHAVPSRDELRDALRRDAMSGVLRAFALAMGEVPRDVVLRVEPEDIPLCQALPAAAYQEDDILVVPVLRRCHWWWPHRRTLAQHCLHHAACPVLVVPPPTAARELGRHWPWRRLQRRRELAALLRELVA